MSWELSACRLKWKQINSFLTKDEKYHFIISKTKEIKLMFVWIEMPAMTKTFQRLETCSPRHTSTFISAHTGYCLPFHPSFHRNANLFWSPHSTHTHMLVLFASYGTAMWRAKRQRHEEQSMVFHEKLQWLNCRFIHIYILFVHKPTIADTSQPPPCYIWHWQMGRTFFTRTGRKKESHCYAIFSSSQCCWRCCSLENPLPPWAKAIVRASLFVCWR